MAIFLLLLFGVFMSASSVWDYSSHSSNLSDWCDEFEKCCPDDGAGSQSPVDIETEKAKFSPSLLDPGLSFTGGYFSRMPGTLVNDGHGIKFEPDKDSWAAHLSGGPLPAGDLFKFAQFHLHWGEDDRTGSEHTVDGQQYAGEIHMVHYNTKYRSLEDAVGHPDGLAVLAFLLDNSDRPGAAKQPTLRAVGDALESGNGVTGDAGGTSFVTSLARILLAPRSLETFYTYHGSLTTPGCDESVTWVVFADKIKVDAGKLLKSFRNQVDGRGKSLSFNWRPTQDIAGRTVRVSKRRKKETH